MAHSRCENRPVEIERIVERLLLDEGQDRMVAGEVHVDLSDATVDGRREDPAGTLVVVHRQAELLQVVQTLCTSSGLSGRLDRRQEQGDQNSNDRDHDQELDERKALMNLRLIPQHGVNSEVKAER